MFPTWLVIVLTAVITASIVAIWPASMADRLRDVRRKGMSQLLALLKEHLVKHQFLRFIPNSNDGRNRIGLWVNTELDPQGDSGKLTITGEDPRQEKGLVIAVIIIDKRLNITLKWDGRTVEYQNALYNDRDKNWMYEEYISQIIGDAIRLIDQYKEDMNKDFPPQDKN